MVFLRRVAVGYLWQLYLEAEGRSQAELRFLLPWLGRRRARVSPRDAHTSRAPAALMLTFPRKGGITLSWWGELFKFLAILLSPGSLQQLWQLEMKGGARPLRAVAGAVPPALLWFPASAPFWHAFLASYTSIFQLCVMSVLIPVKIHGLLMKFWLWSCSTKWSKGRRSRGSLKTQSLQKWCCSLKVHVTFSL